MRIQKALALLLALFAVSSAEAYRPSGWAWYAAPFAYDLPSGDWYWFNTGDEQWVYGFPPASGWQRLNQSALASGWAYFSYPYAYDSDNGAWYYLDESSVQWVANMRTSEWSLFGQSAATVGTLDGRITWAGAGVTNATVNLLSSPGFLTLGSAVTDATGRYAFLGQTNGNYVVEFPAQDGFAVSGYGGTFDAATHDIAEWSWPIFKELTITSPADRSTVTGSLTTVTWLEPAFGTHHYEGRICEPFVPPNFGQTCYEIDDNIVGTTWPVSISGPVGTLDIEIYGCDASNQRLSHAFISIDGVTAP